MVFYLSLGFSKNDCFDLQACYCLIFEGAYGGTRWTLAYESVICFGSPHPRFDVWLELLETATVGCNDLIRSICVYK